MGLLHRLWQQWQQKTGDENGTPQDALYAIVPHFIDGEHLTVATEQTIEVFNPKSGKAERQLYAAETAQIEAAIASSLRAKKTWAETPLATRLSILQTFRELLHAAAEDLTQIVIQEQGVSRDMARREIDYALRLLDDAPQWTQRLGGRYTLHALEHTDVLLQPEPVGLVLGIEHGRLSVSVPAWLISGALSCGNCILFRPAPEHPSVAVFLADLLRRAGLPDGVFNLLQGGQETADALLRHPQINAAVWHNAAAQTVPAAACAATTHTSLALTVDCRAMAVVMPDADMAAVAGTLCSEFVAGCQNGQHLCAVLAVGEAGLTLGTALQQAFAEAAQPGLLPSLAVFHETLRMKEIIREAGAEILYDRDASSPEAWDGGMMLADFVLPDCALMKQPQALPILPIVHVPDWTAAQAVIADNPLVNSVGLFGTDLRTLHHCASTLDTRQIGLNTLVRRVHPLIGLAGIGGDDALAFFTRTRTVAHHW